MGSGASDIVFYFIFCPDVAISAVDQLIVWPMDEQRRGTIY